VRDVKLSREVGNRVKIAAQLQDFDAAAHLGAAMQPGADRFALYALVAAKQAMEQAGLADGGPAGPRTAVIMGTSLGGATTLDDQHFRFYVTGKRPEPMAIPRTMCNAGASLISARYGATGPVFAVSSACSSASQAIGLGAWMVRAGMVDRAIVGGSEAMITASIFCAWEALRVLTPDVCRPFSRKRNGMVLGEGGGVFVLEAEDHARARGTIGLAEIAGYGTTSDAKDLVRPDAAGAAAAMQAALDDAGLAPSAIDYINAHGTGTVANDVTEAQALGLVFGDDLGRVAVSATKPIHGHALGAAGALELAITIMAMRDGVAPPTINCEDPDPACPIDMVPGHARKLKIRAAMTNSFAFGGINAVLLVTPVSAN
jgi:nodulation protein E